MIIEGKYHDLVKECEELDYSDTEAIFLYANNELSKYSWELALVVMKEVGRLIII